MKAKGQYFRKKGGFYFVDQSRLETVKSRLEPADVCSERFLEWYMSNGLLVSTEDAWIEVPISRGWIVAYRMLLQNGVPVIGELRIFPNEADREPGRWSADYLGMRAQVPNGGITAKMARIKIGEHRLGTKEFLEDARTKGWEPLGSMAAPSMPVTKRRRGKDDLFFARFARDYARIQHKRTPAKSLAEKHNISRVQARVFIHECRKRNLLDPANPGSGRPGGILTPYAQQLLDARKKL